VERTAPLPDSKVATEIVHRATGAAGSAAGKKIGNWSKKTAA